MRLQDAGEHDRDAVEHDLGQEHPQHRRADLQRLRPARQAAEQPAHRQRRRQQAEQRHRHQQQQRPGEQRRGGPRRRRPVPGGHGGRQDRHDQRGERPAGDDLEDDVGDGVGDQVGAAEAVQPDRAGEHRGPAEAGDPREHRHRGDTGRRAEHGPGHPHRGAHRGGGAAGCRPSRSSQRSGGVASMTRLKETSSDAPVRPASAASAAAAPGGPDGAPPGPGPGRHRARWRPRHPASCARRGRRAAAPRPLRPPRAGRRRAPPATPTFRARPGRRSSRLTRLAAARDDGAGEQDVRRSGAGRAAGPRPPGRRRPGPTTLTAPEVTRPCRSAAAWPRSPFAATWSGRPPTASSYAPTAGLRERRCRRRERAARHRRRHRARPPARSRATRRRRGGWPAVSAGAPRSRRSRETAAGACGGGGRPDRGRGCSPRGQRRQRALARRPGAVPAGAPPALLLQCVDDGQPTLRTVDPVHRADPLGQRLSSCSACRRHPPLGGLDRPGDDRARTRPRPGRPRTTAAPRSGRPALSGDPVGDPDGLPTTTTASVGGCAGLAGQVEQVAPRRTR